MKEQRKGFFKGILAAVLVFAAIISVSGAQTSKNAVINYKNIKITIDGATVTPKDANGKTVEPFIMDGTTYLPVRAIATALGKEVNWDGTTNTVKITTPKSSTAPVTMYAADGRTVTVKASEVEAYKAVGWYTEPVVLMWAADGRSKYVIKSQVEANKKVGWYDNKSDVMVTMYAKDGRTKQVFKSKVSAEEAVGWYTYPVYKPDGSRKAPYLATSPVAVKYNEYSFYATHDLKITCNRVIKGTAGNILAAKGSSINDTPNGKQEWIVFDFQITHVSSSDGEDSEFNARKVIEKAAFYKADGSSLSVADTGSFSSFLSGYDPSDAKVYPGGSARVIYAILVDKYDGDILMKVPSNAGKSTTWIKLNSSSNTITTSAQLDKFIDEAVPESEQGVRITLKNSLPTSISSKDYSGMTESTVRVTAFDYTSSNTSATITFSGEKTYDAKGAGQSRPVKIGWKLYDSEGYVVEDGVAYGTSIKNGEKFKNCEDSIYSLEPGKYTLEIMNVN